MMALFISVPASGMTGRRIMERSDSIPKAETSFSRVTMTIFKGNRRVDKKFIMEMITIDKTERRSLISFQRPSTMKLLTFSRDNRRDYQWLSMSSGKVKRITDSAKKKSFAGSHFDYGDLSDKNIDDYKYRYAGEVFFGGSLCDRVECFKKSEIIAGQRNDPQMIVYPRREDGFIVKIEFFENKQHIKTLVNNDIKTVSGILTPMRMTMSDAFSDDRTVLEITEAENNIPIPRSKFNREAIKYKD